MGATLQAGSEGPSGARRRRGRRYRPMAEINVTPFVDVMLVLLIIFMVAAPLLTAGVPVELPQSKGAALQSEGEPLTVSLNAEGKLFIQETEVKLEEFETRLNAILQARAKPDEPIFVRGDRNTNYGELVSVMGRIAAAGHRQISLVTELVEAP